MTWVTRSARRRRQLRPREHRSERSLCHQAITRYFSCRFVTRANLAIKLTFLAPSSALDRTETDKMRHLALVRAFLLVWVHLTLVTATHPQALHALAQRWIDDGHRFWRHPNAEQTRIAAEFVALAASILTAAGIIRTNDQVRYTPARLAPKRAQNSPRPVDTSSLISPPQVKTTFKAVVKGRNRTISGAAQAAYAERKASGAAQAAYAERKASGAAQAVNAKRKASGAEQVSQAKYYAKRKASGAAQAAYAERKASGAEQAYQAKAYFERKASGVQKAYQAKANAKLKEERRYAPISLIFSRVVSIHLRLLHPDVILPRLFLTANRGRRPSWRTQISLPKSFRRKRSLRGARNGSAHRSLA